MFLGTFRNDSSDKGVANGILIRDDNGDWVAMTRAVWLPYYDEFSDGRHLVHLGASSTYRHTGQNQIEFETDPVLGTQANNVAAFGAVGDEDWHQIGLGDEYQLTAEENKRFDRQVEPTSATDTEQPLTSSSRSWSKLFRTRY